MKKKGPKFLLITAFVLSLVLLAMALITIFSDNIFYHIASHKCANDDFISAINSLEECESDRARNLERYCFFRSDFDREYPSMLSEFNEERFIEWKSTIDIISENSGDFPDSCKEDVASLKERFDEIDKVHSEFTGFSADIDSLMDIFTVVNTLAGYGESENTYTMSQIKEKLSRWKTVNLALEMFSHKIPDGESVYLLSYLISEVKGESKDIEEILSLCEEEGYDESFVIKVKLSGKKTFQTITGSKGATVCVAEKENYIKELSNGVHSALMKSLNEFYKGN